jgi:hypothetical protein
MLSVVVLVNDNIIFLYKGKVVWFHRPLHGGRTRPHLSWTVTSTPESTKDSKKFDLDDNSKYKRLSMKGKNLCFDTVL